MARQCGVDIDQNCDECFPITASNCNAIEVSAGLTPGSKSLWMVDPLGNQYQTNVTIGLTGLLTIPINTGYPDGIFTKYSGWFEFFIGTSSTDPTPIPLTISAVAYNCIVVEFTVNCCT